MTKVELCRTIGSNIKKYRLDCNMTIAEVAEKTGASTSYQSRLEQGKVNPSAEKLKKMADLFGCRVVDLFEEEKEEGQKSSSNEKAVSGFNEFFYMEASKELTLADNKNLKANDQYWERFRFEVRQIVREELTEQ